MHELESQWNYNTTIGRKSLQWAEHLNAYTYLLCCVIANSPPFSLLSSLLGVHESNTQHLRKLCIKAVIFQRNIYMLEMYNLFAAWKLTDRIVVWNEMTLLQLKCVQACSFFSAGFQKPANIFLINSFGNYALFFCIQTRQEKKEKLTRWILKKCCGRSALSHCNILVILVDNVGIWYGGSCEKHVLTYVGCTS